MVLKEGKRKQGNNYKKEKLTESLYLTVKIARRSNARGGTPIHYLYGYVPPNRVVILKLLI